MMKVIAFAIMLSVPSANAQTNLDPDIEHQLKLLQDLRARMATKLAKPRRQDGCPGPGCVFVSPSPPPKKNEELK